MKFFNKFSIADITITQWILIVAFIILLTPVAFTLTAFWDIFNFSETGQIGDTIGGITAPFINGIAAILVFIAFKEQVRANNLLKELQYIQYIQIDINRLENDSLGLSEAISIILKRKDTIVLDEASSLNDSSLKIVLERFDKIQYVIDVFFSLHHRSSKLQLKESKIDERVKLLYHSLYESKMDIILSLEKDSSKHVKLFRDRIEGLIKSINHLNEIMRTKT